MNLTAFKIKNFKSIIDSGWCDLSLDNLTGFVGQNESGKSSILQALYAFSQGEVQSEDLRTDDTLPEVSCSFQVSEEELNEILKDNILPSGVVDYIKENNWRVNIIVKWNSAKKATAELEESRLNEIFASAKQKELEDANAFLEATGTTNPSLASENPPVENAVEAAPVTPPVEQAAAVPPVNETTPAVIETTPVVIASPKEIPATKILSAQQFCDLISQNVPSFIFFEDGSSLLPNTIDVDDIKNKKIKAEGYRGVINLLTIADIDLAKLTADSSAKVKKYIDTKNKEITVNFQEFWSQTIGKNNRIAIEFQLNHYDTAAGAAKAGKAYLEFWINDGTECLHPKQRSEGVRWFLSFYLQMRANALKENKSGSIFLIDEPGRSLHARAQEDALKVFEDIKDKIKIIYTTHSPYMIKLDTLYRIRAVQRTDEDDEYSDTKIIGAHHLGSATSNTLAPILDNMGIGFSSQNVIQKDNNILLEEISAFYYLKAFTQLLNLQFQPNYIPATGVSKVPQLAYMLMGWGINFIVAVDDDASGRTVYKDLRENLCLDNEDFAKKKLYKIKVGKGIEDLFSKTDFKKHVLVNESAAVGDSNSDFVKQNGESKPILAGAFYNAVKDKKITLETLNKQTVEAFQKVLKDLQAMLDTTTPEKAVSPAELNGKGATVK